MELINGNNLEAFSEIPDNSVDLVLTDPPYNISQKNNFETMNRQSIDFGEWDKNADILTWLTLLDRIVKKNGSVVIFNSWRNVADIADVLDASGFETKDLIRWVKDNPMPRNRDRRYVADFEQAVWAVKKRGKWTFNRLNDTYDRPLIMSGLTPKSEKSFGNHPTQKPIAVMTELLMRHSNPGDVVLDPFMGSGSTGVACVNTNRDFIGIELDQTYFKIAENRINEAQTFLKHAR